MRALRTIAANLATSAAVIAAAALVLAADRLWPFRLPAQLVLLSWPLLIAGSVLIALSVATFVAAARATGALGDAPKQLVTTGPFRIVRNPIYVGAALLLFAIALYCQSPSFLTVAVAFVAGIDLYVRRVEEPRLKARFGQRYEEYMWEVPRWISRWPGRKRRFRR